jgi:hypothetical protein
MAFTLTDLAALDAAIASGATEVRFQDRTVRYNNTASLMQARTFIFNQLNPNPATAQPAIIRQVRMVTDRGV